MSGRANGINADGWFCDFPECKGYANVFAHGLSACKIHMFSDWWKEHAKEILSGRSLPSISLR